MPGLFLQHVPCPRPWHRPATTAALALDRHSHVSLRWGWGRCAEWFCLSKGWGGVQKRIVSPPSQRSGGTLTSRDGAWPGLHDSRCRPEPGSFTDGLCLLYEGPRQLHTVVKGPRGSHHDAHAYQAWLTVLMVCVPACPAEAFSAAQASGGGKASAVSQALAQAGASNAQQVCCHAMAEACW